MARLLLATLSCLAVACTKDEPAPASSSSPANAPAPEAARVASAPPSSASASAPSAPASAPASSALAPSAPASSAPRPSASVSAASAAAAAKCGDRPLAPCPLYAWMKTNASPAINDDDFDGLAVALDKVAGFAPPAYTNWASIAHDGADAARAQSLDAVKASCRSCHTQYRDRYKREMRDRAL